MNGAGPGRLGIAKELAKFNLEILGASRTSFTF